MSQNEQGWCVLGCGGVFVGGGGKGAVGCQIWGVLKERFFFGRGGGVGGA